MSQTAVDDAPDAQLAQEIEARLEQIDRRRFVDLGLMVLFGSIVGVVFVITLRTYSSAFLPFALLFASLALIVSYPRMFARRTSAALMPAIAKHLNMGYGKGLVDPQGVLDDGLMRGQSLTSGDVIGGRLAGHKFAFRAMTTKAGTKRKRVAFRGYLISVQGIWGGPDLLATLGRRRKNTLGALFGGGEWAEAGERDGWTLHERKSKPPQRERYGPFCAMLERVSNVVEEPASMRAARAREDIVTFVVHDNKRHFDLGGLFTSRDTRRELVKRAVGDLELPLKLVQAALSRADVRATSAS